MGRQIYCYKCGSPMNKKARKCPNCGAKNKKRKSGFFRKLKKFLAFVLVIFLLYNIACYFEWWDLIPDIQINDNLYLFLHHRETGYFSFIFWFKIEREAGFVVRQETFSVLTIPIHPSWLPKAH